MYGDLLFFVHRGEKAHQRNALRDFKILCDKLGIRAGSSRSMLLDFRRGRMRRFRRNESSTGIGWVGLGGLGRLQCSSSIKAMIKAIIRSLATIAPLMQR
jgi:hypothetical protein